MSHSKAEKDSNSIYRYTIKFGRVSGNSWPKLGLFMKDVPLEIVKEFFFYDNSSKKIEDL